MSGEEEEEGEMGGGGGVVEQMMSPLDPCSLANRERSVVEIEHRYCGWLFIVFSETEGRERPGERPEGDRCHREQGEEDKAGGLCVPTLGRLCTPTCLISQPFLLETANLVCI